MGLLGKLLFFPVAGPVAGIRWSLGKVQRVVEEQLVDDTPIKQELMELQMLLELGDIDDAEYLRREADVMQRLRDVRAASGSGWPPPAVPCASRGRPTTPNDRGLTGIDALLASLPSWTLVGGKGGVGKATSAPALG